MPHYPHMPRKLYRVVFKAQGRAPESFYCTATFAVEAKRAMLQNLPYLSGWTFIGAVEAVGVQAASAAR